MDAVVPLRAMRYGGQPSLACQPKLTPGKVSEGWR